MQGAFAAAHSVTYDADFTTIWTTANRRMLRMTDGLKNDLLNSFIVFLAGCETKYSATKDQLGEAGQDTAVMTRDGRAAAGAVNAGGNAVDNA